jgi:TonB-linked SusC/RagA family outer membrane protein
MNVKISRSLGIIAALYFTANFNAQTTPRDTVSKEQKIEEVVVIGYGSVKKSNLTSAVSTVKSETFDDRPIYNVGQALQGNAAGVNVIQSSGKPGAAIDVKIRGNNSISSSVNPLYVVDGIQTFDISGINPDDITDMTILKDATSAAIYGINGSSGVVIVTTKRGKANKPQLAFNAYWGMSKTVNNIDVLNLDQYKALMGDIASNGGTNYLPTINSPKYAGINTNWKDEVFRTGFDQNYNVNYSFGNEKVKAYTALGYQGIDGIINPARFDRISAKMNLDAKITDWLKLTGNFNYINTTLKNTNDNLGTSRGGVILSALNTPSFLPIYGSQLAIRDRDSSGNYIDGSKDGQFALNPFQSSWENPVAYQSRKNETQTNRFMSNLGLEVNLLKNLVWKPTVSLDLIESTNDQFTDGYQTSYGREKKGIGGKYLSTYQDLNIENTLTYTIKSGIHDLALLGGNQIHEKRNSWHNYWGDSFPEGTSMFDFNTAVNRHESLVKENLREMSFFGRALYTLDNKYTIMGVFRYNGSSALADGNKWGFFPGVSASWVVSNEDFLSDNKIISELKLRGGWGQTGNVSGIPPYSHYNLERQTELGNAGSWYTRQWDSSNLGWEVTNDTNIGVDFGFLSNRIKLSVDAYHRKTNDLIIPIPMGPAQVPFYRNVGNMENKGLEFALNTQNFKGEGFNWNTNFNISFTKNKVLQLNWVPILDKANIETVGANLVRFTPGQAISSFYGYQVDHIDSQTGDIVYKDNNGNGYFDTGDRTFIGNPNPDFSFGFSNSFSYKNWYLDVLVTGSYGGEIYNASRFDLEMMNDFKNQSTAVLDRWTTPGQITNTPRANSPSSQYVSDRFVEDGSFLKLKSATLGYNFLSPFKGVSKINLYVTGQNLLTWTDYTGFDPEVNAFNTTNGVSGVDYGTYPQVRTFIFGLKANF